MQSHKSGTLLVHMFELNPGSQDRLIEFFDVLSGKKGSKYSNSWRCVEGSPEGYRGMATTALKTGLPIRNWDFESDVGLLFDFNDHANITPVNVSSGDSNTNIHENDILHITHKVEHPNLDRVAKLQERNPHTYKSSGYKINLASPEEVSKHAELARKALPAMWEGIRETKWDEYVYRQARDVKGINEINANVHMRGVRGILINQPSISVEQSTSMLLVERQFVEQVEDAKKICRCLKNEYSDFVPQDLPIIVYNPTSRQQLIPMAEKDLQNPQLFLRQLYNAQREQSNWR